MYIQRFLLSLVNIVLSIVELLIGLRIILKFFGASQGAPFVQWIYETTDPLLLPYLGMFPSPKLTGGFVIEFSAVFGFILYALIGSLITEFVETLDYRKRITTSF